VIRGKGGISGTEPPTSELAAGERPPPDLLGGKTKTTPAKGKDWLTKKSEKLESKGVTSLRGVRLNGIPPHKGKEQERGILAT